jgi:hypothetical protein
MPRSTHERLKLLATAWRTPVYVIVEEFIMSEIEKTRVLAALKAWEPILAKPKSTSRSRS